MKNCILNSFCGSRAASRNGADIRAVTNDSSGGRGKACIAPTIVGNYRGTLGTRGTIGTRGTTTASAATVCVANVPRVPNVPNVPARARACPVRDRILVEKIPATGSVVPSGTICMGDISSLTGRPTHRMDTVSSTSIKSLTGLKSNLVFNHFNFLNQ
jgi:hypothetical protein